MPPDSVYDMGRVPYRAALAFQHRAVELRSRGEAPDVLYAFEHEPVLTVGRSGPLESLRAGTAELARRGIEVVPVERGGDVTYHGPGQIVGYPIVSLDGLPCGRDLHRYLRDMEQGLIEALPHSASARPGALPTPASGWESRRSPRSALPCAVGSLSTDSRSTWIRT